MLPFSNQNIYIVTYVTILTMIKNAKGILNPELPIAYLSVMHWFFSFPRKEVSLNALREELSVFAKYAKTTIRSAVLELEKEQFLERQVLGKTWRIRANLDHSYHRSFKVGYALTMVMERGIIEGVLREYPQARAILLFGSYRKGDDTEESDLDIAVEITGTADPQMVSLGMLERFGYRRKVKINGLIFSRNNIDLNVFANIANGILLYGFLEVKP